MATIIILFLICISIIKQLTDTCHFQALWFFFGSYRESLLSINIINYDNSRTLMREKYVKGIT